jgi:hypothetical protein
MSKAAQMRKLSRELEKEEARAASSSKQAAKLRERINRMRDKCPHARLDRDKETGIIFCKDCEAEVGFPKQERVEVVEEHIDDDDSFQDDDGYYEDDEE